MSNRNNQQSHLDQIPEGGYNPDTKQGSGTFGGNSHSIRPAGLVFFEEQEKPRQYLIFSHSEIRGRCAMEVFTTSSLQLEYPFLDEHQCEIFKEKGQWFYRNLSDNVYTFVADDMIHKGDVVPLKDCTVIRLVNDRMLTAVFFEDYISGRDWRILNMDDGRHQVTITERGKEENGDSLTLSYESGHWEMEEIHAFHVLHNGDPVSKKVKIRINDVIQVGETRFIFEGSGLVYGYPIQRSGLSISIDERSAHKALKKVMLLKDINLQINPGEMVLILGGSGAGKSTFVNAVTGYEKAKATIQAGNIDFYKDYSQVKHQIGFVPQENLLREEDTVYATVENAADMRLPKDMSASEKERRIRAVLETFGLTGREKELVSKLSGGQKKRLSICTEFVSSPTLFILDEPDSGLDGIMATELMENLRMIACQGKMVLVITHQPDRVADLFDKVIVLAKSTETKVGQLAFYGEVQEARDFFGVDTMENVVKRINARNEGGEGRADEFIEKYKTYSATREERPDLVFKEKNEDDSVLDAPADEHTDAGKGEKEKGGLMYKSRLEQIPIYLGKQFRLLIYEKNWKVLPMSAIIAYLVTYVLGKQMFRNMEFTKFGSLAVVCVCIWNGMFNSIQVICKERSIIKREHRTGLHISAYVMAHMIYQAVICMIQVVITITIFWIFGVYFPDTGLITGFFTVDLGISMFLMTYAADTLALLASCISHTTTTAMTIMPFLLVIQLIFAGSIFPLEREGAEFLSKLTISNWGINAVNIAADYNGQDSIVIYTAVNSMQDAEDETLTKLHNVMKIPEVKKKVQHYSAQKLQDKNFEYTKGNLLKCWGILALFSAVYVFLGTLALELIDKDKR